jgi:cytoskeletal protein CcmA (bactofilin family)
VARTNMAKTQDSETVISEGTVIRGKVRGSGGLHIDGRLEGDVQIDGSMTIGEGGRVVSQTRVQASEVTILGELEADIEARGPVRMGSEAKVSGDIKGTSFAMASGASFSGVIDADFELPTQLSRTNAQASQGKRR